MKKGKKVGTDGQEKVNKSFEKKTGELWNEDLIGLGLKLWA